MHVDLVANIGRFSVCEIRLSSGQAASRYFVCLGGPEFLPFAQAMARHPELAAFRPSKLESPSASRQGTAAFYSFDAWLRNSAIGGWAELSARFPS
jgi:hypothetical protein